VKVLDLYVNKFYVSINADSSLSFQDLDFLFWALNLQLRHAFSTTPGCSTFFFFFFFKTNH